MKSSRENLHEEWTELHGHLARCLRILGHASKKWEYLSQTTAIYMVQFLITIVACNLTPANLKKSEIGTNPPPSPSPQSWGSALPPALSRVQDAQEFLH